MKTTVEIDDELLREAKIAAAQRGESLKDLLNTALASHLQGGRSMTERGWRSVFGKATADEVAAVDEVVAREFDQIDSNDWQ